MTTNIVVMLLIGFGVGVWVGWLGGAFMAISARRPPQIQPQAAGLSTQRRHVSSAIPFTSLRRVK